MATLSTWIFGLMTTLSSPEKAAALPAYPGWQETAQEREERYHHMADAVDRVVRDPQERMLFSGKDGRAQTAAVLLSLAFHESGFAPDADVGPCYRGRDGKGERCDSGMSACFMQVRVGAGTTSEGWSRDDLFAYKTKSPEEQDLARERCVRAGLHIARRSFNGCRKQPFQHKLAIYASGSCSGGLKASETRMGTARRLVSLLPLPEVELLPVIPAPRPDPASSFYEKVRSLLGV